MVRAYTADLSTGTVSGSLMPAEDVFTELSTLLTARTSNSTQSWELYDDVSAFKKIYKSVGDRTINSGAGNTTIFLQLEAETATRFRASAFQDWSTASSTGSRGTTTSGDINFTVSTDVEYYFSVDDYELCWLSYQGAGTIESEWRSFSAGSTMRDHVADGGAGVAFSTAEVLARAPRSVYL